MAPINLIIHIPDEGNTHPAVRAASVLDDLDINCAPGTLVSIECEWVETVEMVAKLVKSYEPARINWRQGRPTP